LKECKKTGKDGGVVRAELKSFIWLDHVED
jgi:hypothetical protein